MKIIIPYRENSTRCIGKNLRDFYNGKSILDITIEKFIGNDVILASVPSETTKEVALNHKCNTIDLQEEDDGWSELFYEIATKLEAGQDEPVCIWTATEITYFINNNVSDFLRFGEKELRENNKTTSLVRKLKHFLLDENFQPENFSPGPWHPYSQQLKQKYIVGWASVTTKRKMLKYRYCWGPSAAIYVAKDPYIDIDTEEEFKISQALWSLYD